MASRLLLPSQRALQAVPNQGWLIPTNLSKSLIPGAGNARFTAGPVAAQGLLCVKPIVHMASVTSLISVPADRTIAFETVDELERYVALSAQEGGFTREEILDCYENFIYSIDGKRACLNNSTWTVNHADEIEEGLNLRFTLQTLDDGAQAIVGEAVCDMGAGVELRNNYRKDFDIPSFYSRYCRDNGFKDVRTNVLDTVDGMRAVRSASSPVSSTVGLDGGPSY